jgi:hypothetical protein
MSMKIYVCSNTAPGNFGDKFKGYLEYYNFVYSNV